MSGLLVTGARSSRVAPVRLELSTSVAPLPYQRKERLGGRLSGADVHALSMREGVWATMLLSKIYRIVALPRAMLVLTKGDSQEVVVTDGPFEGMRGTLLELRGATRVAVRLSAIRQAMGVEMDRALLRPLKL